MNLRGNPALAQYRFKKGQSGNPAGRPKAFSIHRLVAEALEEGTLREALDAFRKELKKDGRLLACLEFAAKLNREVGATGKVDVARDGDDEPIKITLRWGEHA
jgi:2-phospho-L-lactate transferase/gluconeogenesis factor (CofD/UPF0052 family)